MWVFFLFAGLSAVFAEVSVHTFDGEKVFRVTPDHEEQLEVFDYLARVMQVDFWRPDSVAQVKTGTTVDFRVEADQCYEVERLLQENGLNYEILIDNLQDVLNGQFNNHVRSAGYQYEKYNSWETIEAWTADIANENPGLVSRSQIGTTFEGRPMYLLKVGKPSANKKAIFMDCGFHAREWISPAFCQWFVREAVRTYGKETIMTQLLDNLDFYVLPVLNIDGYVYTWTKNRMWRKTRSVNADTTCIGTDPNRNFNAGWCSIGASRRPCDDTFCGTAPESEKETKALADFIRENLSTIKAYLTIHSYSQLLLYPYSYTYDVTKDNVELKSKAKTKSGSMQLYNPDRFMMAPKWNYQNSEAERKRFQINTWKLEAEKMGAIPIFTIQDYGGQKRILPCWDGFSAVVKWGKGPMWGHDAHIWGDASGVAEHAIAKAAVKELTTLHGTTYTYGPGASTIYPAAGGSDDWAYDQGIKYSFTFELRDTGRYGFALPESKIKPTCEETLIAVKYIASYVLEHLY